MPGLPETWRAGLGAAWREALQATLVPANTPSPLWAGLRLDTSALPHGLQTSATTSARGGGAQGVGEGFVSSGMGGQVVGVAWIRGNRGKDT